MEGLYINTIPTSLLARILLQLNTLSPRENLDLVSILQKGLQQYGDTDRIDAFLDYCQSTASPEISWPWKNYTIRSDTDWDVANGKKSQALIGLRFLLSSETARQKTELTRFAKALLYSSKCVRFFSGRPIGVNDLLTDTMNYLKEQGQLNPAVESVLGLCMEQYNKDREAFEQQSRDLDSADYHLMGALWVRYDATASCGSAPRSWCLYLRDYMDSTDGTMWRVILENEETRISSNQALSDIRGEAEGEATPSEFSRDYRPVCLFYANLDMIQQPKEQSQVITLEDYTFEDEYEYGDQTVHNVPAEESEVCKHCGIEEIVENVNDMFFCERCDRGVHQLCEDPPIHESEKELDPWFCRACCRAQNIPIPTANIAAVDKNYLASALKRKRDGAEEDEAAAAKKAFS